MSDARRDNRILAVGIVAGLFLAVLFLAWFLVRPVTSGAEPERVVVRTDTDVVSHLRQNNLIRNALGFRLAIFLQSGRFDPSDMITPGAYRISPSMSVWHIAGVLRGEPYMKWVVIPEGYRKEQIASVLAEPLGWEHDDIDTFVNECTEREDNYREGVYFPDTYLISSDETPCATADRLRARFEEVFAPYGQEALAQNIRWPTLLKIASLVQREAADADDMPLIAGIIWNRLLAGMRLDIDATLQYVLGNERDGWWPTIRPDDRTVDSPYNTYRHTGLPPTPIANPGIDAIEAVLSPAETDCFYYLHDEAGDIHCAETYDGHQENIDQYLQ